MTPSDVYAALVAAGCTIDHHESDLYVKADEQSRAITRAYPNRSVFVSQIDHALWIECPFAYMPFWEAKARAGERAGAR